MNSTPLPPSFRPIQEIRSKENETEAQRDKVYIAMPCGKKSYLWISNDGEEDGCFLIYPSSVQSNFHAQTLQTKNPTPKVNLQIKDHEYYYGTLVSGTLVYPPGCPGENEYFVADDLLYYKGIYLKHSPFSERLEYLVTFFHSISIPHLPHVHLSTQTHKIIQKVILSNMYSLGDIYVKPKYVIHHWQKRSFSENRLYESLKEAPHFPSPLSFKPNEPNRNNNSNNNIPLPPILLQRQETKPLSVEFATDKFKEYYYLPIYKEKVTFKVIAEDQCDVYSLYAYVSSNQWVLYGFAGIFSFETSQFLNRHFYSMHPQCLDDIEESDTENEDDDEEDSNRMVKVDTEKSSTRKELFFECVFNSKFRKWVPFKLSSINQVVLIQAFQKSKQH